MKENCMLKWKLAHDTLRTQEKERQTDRQDNKKKKKKPRRFFVFLAMNENYVN